MKLVTTIATAASLLCCVQGTALSNSPKPRLGFLMWSAFQCATYAEMAGNKEIPGNKAEQRRLFQVGYDAGTKFLTGIRNHTISNAEAADSPWQVEMLLGGPTNDFMIGRIFQSASDDAYDSVVKKDANGELLAPSAYLSNPVVKATAAWTKYSRENCQLIQAVRR